MRTAMAVLAGSLALYGCSPRETTGTQPPAATAVVDYLLSSPDETILADGGREPYRLFVRQHHGQGESIELRFLDLPPFIPLPANTPLREGLGEEDTLMVTVYRQGWSCSLTDADIGTFSHSCDLLIESAEQGGRCFDGRSATPPAQEAYAAFVRHVVDRIGK